MFCEGDLNLEVISKYFQNFDTWGGAGSNFIIKFF